MKSKFLTKFLYGIYPLVLMSAVVLFIVFMILGFVVNDKIASDVFFSLSFISLILYIPSFILLSKLQSTKWYKMCTRCISLRRAKQTNYNKALLKYAELKKEYNIVDSDTNLEGNKANTK